MTQVQTLPPPPATARKSFQKATDAWIDPDTHIFRVRDVHVRGNMKSLKNTLEPVYGCRGGLSNQGYGCPWGCHAKFTCKKLRADFDTPVPQVVDPKVLLPQLRKVKGRGIDWVRIGVMGEPSHHFDNTIHLAKLAHMIGLIPVLFTRFWEWPTDDQLAQLARYGTHLHISISAFDGKGLTADGVPVARSKQWVRRVEEVHGKYTALGGKGLWRVVTFHFDDDMEVAEELWKRQDELMAQKYVLEQPARLMKGKKHTNPVWKYVPRWAYFKAPKTSDHKFSAHNHNWTAGLLYDRPACWVGCKECEHWCVTRGDEA